MSCSFKTRTHRESEIYVNDKISKEMGVNVEGQKSFKDGVEVPYGTKGSTRPDGFYDSNGNYNSIETKNYNPENFGGLKRAAKKQYFDRIKNLPDGSLQKIYIDLATRKLDESQIKKLEKLILELEYYGYDEVFVIK